jgi:eukaryotic-like serine/threonine-protein kinase
MGEVWRARDPRLEREVAVKVLPAELAADRERLSRFEREARALAALSHPSIVTIYSVEEAAGTRFLTMELVEGETLERRIPTEGMTLERFLSIAIPLAEALAEAHLRGVLHRDLKPANVMVTAQGRVKILDFGLAKLAQGQPDDLTMAETGSLEAMTRQGQILGTVPYMSPEQIQGRGVEARSDIFSLGIMLYEMATGHRPFAGGSAVEVLSSILRDEPPPLGELRPDLPQQLGRILRLCLAKAPDRRFQTAQDLRNQLEALQEEARQTRSSETLAGRGTPRPPTADDESAPSAALAPSGFLRRLALATSAVVLLLAFGVVTLWLSGRPEAALEPPARQAEALFPRTALAVLPFRNLSADPADAYFAGGLHDELLTQLSRVAALSLRGRTSVLGYGETTKPVRQIAEELRIGTLLEGSVQVIRGRLRVNLQLIDVASEELLWGESFDRALDDVFDIQREVAQRVVSAVGAVLANGAPQAWEEAPTPDPEAYRLYLQGREYQRRPGRQRHSLEVAQQLFERALALDPEFALAYAALAEVHGWMRWAAYDTSESRLEAFREAAAEALRLAPDRPEARVAMGLWHYWGRRDYEAALSELEAASAALPNDARVAELIGFLNRRLGRWEAAISAFHLAAELDPRHPDLFFDLGAQTFQTTRRFADGVAACERALELAPDFHGAAVRKGWIVAAWQGRLDALRAALEEIPANAQLGPMGNAPAHWASLLLLERDADRLLEHIEASREAQPDALIWRADSSLHEAWAYRLRGDSAAAALAFGAALEHLEGLSLAGALDWRGRSLRGLALAGLGRRGEALAEADWLERIATERRDAFSSPRFLEARAAILAQAGAIEPAIAAVEELLAQPSFVSAHLLALDPVWDPIRQYPRFRALLASSAET